MLSANATCRNPKCGKSLAGKQASAKTCSSACRNAYNRILRQRKLTSEDKQRYEQSVAEASEIVGTGMIDIAKDVAHELVTPVIKDEIDRRGVREAINDMLDLTPLLVETLEQCLSHEDPDIRLKAAKQVAQYTLGQGLHKTPEEEQENANQISIQFELPRPSNKVTAEVIEGSAYEFDQPVLKECGFCHEMKDSTEFLGEGIRCTACDRELRENIPDFNNEH